MKFQLFNLFEQNAKNHYDSLKKSIDNEIALIKKAELEFGELQKLKLELFNKHYSKNIIVDIEETEKDKFTEEVHIDEAKNFIGNGFTFSMSSNTIPLTEIWYKLKIKSGLFALNHSVNLNKRSVRGNLKGYEIHLQFHYQDNNIDNIGPNAREQKDQFISLVKQNATELNSFFETNKESFLTYIQNSIENKVAHNKKEKEDRDKF